MRSIGGRATAWSTLYSAVDSFQNWLLPTWSRKSFACIASVGSLLEKNTPTNLGAVSTGPPYQTTCGGAGCGAGYTSLGWPMSAPPPPVPGPVLVVAVVVAVLVPPPEPPLPV